MTKEKLTDDARQWLEQQTNEFMRPYAARFTRDEALEELAEERDGDTEEIGAGWYCRLSAPGYVDATDWSGPYESETAAWMALYKLYGDD